MPIEIVKERSKKLETRKNELTRLLEHDHLKLMRILR